MKKSLYIILALMCHWSVAQTRFEWASAPQGVDMEYISMNATPDGGVFAVSDNDQLNEKRYEWKFVDGKGKEIEDYSDLVRNDGYFKLLRFDKDGGLLWYKSWDDDRVKIQSSEVGEDGKIYLLVYVEYDGAVNEYYDYDYDDEEELEIPIIEFGTVPNGYDGVRTEVGYALLQLSAEGDLEEVISLSYLESEEGEIEINDLEIYGDQFLIAGTAEDGELTNMLGRTREDEGGDFVMLVDRQGKMVWADIIVHKNFRCCSSYLERNNLSVAEDGTIYFGATYSEGASFSNGFNSIAPLKYNPKHYYRPRESYVVSYSPEGKINWVRTAESISYFEGLKASSNGVYVAHVVREDRSFGENIDTTAMQHVVFTYLDKKGKTKWNLVTDMVSVGGLVIDDRQHLIAAGRLNKSGSYYLKKGKLGKFEINEKEESVVVKLTSKGTISDVWSVDLDIKGFEYPLLVMNTDGDFILGTEGRIGASLKLDVLDPTLPPVLSGWGAAIIAKIKF